jgi:hypothetical protein
MNTRTHNLDTLMVRIVVAIFVIAGSLVLAGMASTPLLIPAAALLTALGIAGYFAVAGTPNQTQEARDAARRAPARSDAPPHLSGNR